MRFMMLMIPGVYQQSGQKSAQADFTPDAEGVAKMMKYNEELAKAGALISLDGLRAPATGARVSYKGGKPRVTDGPFTESKEVVGGYWLIQTATRQEAIDWARRIPAADDDIVEVRQVFENSDFPEDVRAVAQNSAVQAIVEKYGRP